MKFGRTSRLLSRTDFDAVFRAARSPLEGRIIRRPRFVVYVRNSNQSARLGVSIPKKVVRRANKRNRMKRCLREYFRLHQAEFLGDIVVRWVKSPEQIDFDTLAAPLSLLKLKQLKDRIC